MQDKQNISKRKEAPDGDKNVPDIHYQFQTEQFQIQKPPVHLIAVLNKSSP